MGTATTDRRVSAARVMSGPGSLGALNRRTSVRPYTQFTRGGIYRFRPQDFGPTLFRVA
jgi:hypothetical protein